MNAYSTPTVNNSDLNVPGQEQVFSLHKRPMGRPKLSEGSAKDVVISFKVRAPEKRALDEIIERMNVKRRASGEPTEIGITDFFRRHILVTAAEEGISVEAQPSPKAKPAAKRSRKS